MASIRSVDSRPPVPRRSGSSLRLAIPENHPDADRVISALAAFGVTVERVNGTFVALECPSAECSLCGGVHAVGEMTEKVPLGGLVCPTCMDIARRLWRKAVHAGRLQLDEFAHQLPQIVRDIRAGCEEPTLYRGFEGP